MANGRGLKIGNEYAQQVHDIYEETPKAVFAAIAISRITNGGDELDKATELILKEWVILYEAGIVPQKPPKEAFALNIDEQLDNEDNEF